MWELIQRLRHMDPSDSARLALQQVGEHFYRESCSSIPGLTETTDEFVHRVVAEFIFSPYYCAGQRGHGRLKPSSLKELQLLETIASYYQHLDKERNVENVRTPLFQALFGDPELNESRQNILCKLVSLALGVRCKNLLDSTAVWMQARGCHTTLVKAMVETLIHDYCALIPETPSVLRELPVISPHFACNVLSTATMLYKQPAYLSASKQQLLFQELIPMVTDWITDDSRLALMSLFHSQHTSGKEINRTTLWTSPTKPNTQTPIPGLVRWVTQGPLLDEASPKCKRHITDLTTGSTKFPDRKKIDAKIDRSEEVPSLLWSKLHLGILHTLLAFPSLPGAAQLEVITLADMRKMVDEVQGLLQQKGIGVENGAISSDLPVDIQLALDRLIQVLQIALATGAFRCSLADLRSICNALPQTKLKSILEGQHLSTAPPPMHNAM